MIVTLLDSVVDIPGESHIYHGSQESNKDEHCCSNENSQGQLDPFNACLIGSYASLNSSQA